MAGDLPKEQKDEEEEGEKEMKKKRRRFTAEGLGRMRSIGGGRSPTRAEDLLLGQVISY